jgi:redox-sensing transcriptional repressor
MEKLSGATTRRLPLYYRCLSDLEKKGEDKVSSSILEKILKIDAATIRRDFSYFGQMGRRGYGYDVKTLLRLFNDALEQSTIANVALIGVGNLGRALLNFKFHRIGNARISAAFDVNPELIDTIQSKVPVYGIDDIAEQVKEQNINVAILAVPASEAQKMADLVIAAGVEGIMNFTTELIEAPEEKVLVRNVDLSAELQALIYGLKQRNREKYIISDNYIIKRKL